MCAFSVNIASHYRPYILFAEETVTVIYPYDGKLDDELAMKPGDVITVATGTSAMIGQEEH